MCTCPECGCCCDYGRECCPDCHSGNADHLGERGGCKRIDPSALAYDVHDLMIYNEKARKIGKPELTYGYWAEKGKPATP